MLSSDDKRIWRTPELQCFTSANEAIAHFSARGMFRRAEAVGKLAVEEERRGRDAARRKAAAGR